MRSLRRWSRWRIRLGVFCICCLSGFVGGTGVRDGRWVFRDGLRCGASVRSILTSLSLFPTVLSFIPHLNSLYEEKGSMSARVFKGSEVSQWFSVLVSSRYPVKFPSRNGRRDGCYTLCWWHVRGHFLMFFLFSLVGVEMCSPVSVLRMKLTLRLESSRSRSHRTC